jgi:3D (Asp-Asp-Asp) domain-containing protein
MKILTVALVALALWTTSGVVFAAKAQASERSLTVTVTAFNATKAQTDGKPRLGAWGDKLDAPGIRAVAVSPDLLAKGLGHGTRIRIEGLDGEYVVLDRTSGKWKNRVDVFMGTDVAAAKRFGKKRLKISWTPAR